jgi:cysteine desulfurase/selenocysteine lyase
LGGGTIDALEGTTPIFEPIPARLEAGVCNYDGAVGGAAAIRWLQSVGQAEILKHVTTLNAIATEGLAGVERITLLGPEDPSLRTSVLSFHIDGLESEAMARLLDTRSNVMVRHGKFCVHNWFNSAPFPDAIRASFSAYNTEEEVRTMIETVRGAALMLA